MNRRSENDADSLFQHSRITRRVIKQVVQQGRSERRAEVYPLGYIEGQSDARTLLAACFITLR